MSKIDYISSTKLGQETKHNKKSIDKVADILKITALHKATQTYYTQEQCNLIIDFINNHSPLESFFSKLEIYKSYGCNIKTLTAFRNIVDWDRSRVLKCIEYLDIKPITTKGQTDYYSDDDFIKFTTFINNKLSELNSLNNYLTKRQICKKLKLHYDKFETLCRKFNITPIFDWGFGKDSKLYSNESFNFLFNLIEENKKQSEIKYTITELSKIFQKTDSCIAKVIEKLNIPYFESITREYLIDDKSFLILQDYFSKTEISGSSYFEKEICEFVKSIYSNEIVENDRKIIYPKELDIYIPDKNVAIECDGLYWHSTEQLTSKGQFMFSSDEKKHYKNKQLIKTLLCEEKGIRLIHIFEDEWNTKKEICKSILASSLGIYKQKIFARKCEVKEINLEDWKKFLHENHIQDYTFAEYRLGLYYKDELVQGIGITKSNHKQGEIELNRMVTKLNTQVIGGFSKLMSHSIKMWNFSKIYSYISRRLFDGKGYYASNFKIVKTNEPTYFYVKHGQRFPRYNFMKNKIKKMYNKGELSYWNENETEELIMNKNQFGKLYDCGTIKVVYYK